MKKWEYEVITVSPTRKGLSSVFDEDVIKKTLTLMGQNGWELTEQIPCTRDGYLQSIICTFKRELAQ